MAARGVVDTYVTTAWRQAPTLHNMGIFAFSTGVNWSTFVPDLIVGIATGLFVGVVLLFAQGRAQKAKSRADSKFAWESFKPRLSGAVYRSWVMDLDNLLPIPAALVAVDDLAAPAPLALWNRHFKKPDEAIELVVLLARQRASFESSATDVESSIGMLAAEYISEGPDELIVERVIRARAYGFPDTEVHGTVTGLFARANIARLTSMADALAADPRMAASIERYMAVASLYTDSIQRLRLLLSPAEDDDEPTVKA